MPRFSDHQHSQASTGNPAVKPLSEAYAERGFVHPTGAGGVTHSSSKIKLVPYSQRRPYEEPKRRKLDNPDLKLCSYDGCKAYPMKDKGICYGHSRKEAAEAKKAGHDDAG